MTSRLALFGVVAFALTLAPPPTASAADVPVNYTVDEKALKAAIAGTMLTFELHADSGCSAAVHTEAIAVENVALIERLKLFKPKGAIKPPNTDRLNAVLTGVTPQSTFFLKVTGTGVTPVGGNCQLQFSGPPAGTSLPCASQVGNEVFFTSCNVNVRSGSGNTGAVNGLGNLVVGYNDGICAMGFFGAEKQTCLLGSDCPVNTCGAIFPGQCSSGHPCTTTADCPANSCVTSGKTGSHNLVIGAGHSYTSSAGFVAGTRNTVSAFAASVSGGKNNTASGLYCSVSGGQGGTAGSGVQAASVSGGLNVVESIANGWSAGWVGGASGPARFFSH